MKARKRFINSFVAAILPILAAGAALAEPETLDSLFERLKSADEGEASRIERQITMEWSKSGSPAMDLLLKRGNDALQQGDTEAAIGHLTALVDHAPDFAEGWNARAAAYFTAGQYGPAVSDIAHALQLNPRHFSAMTGFGMILEETGRDDEALDVYRAVLAIHPHLEPVREAVERLEAKAHGQDI